MTDAEIKIRAREARIAVCGVSSPRRIAGFRSGAKDHSSTGIKVAIRALRDLSKPLPRSLYGPVETTAEKRRRLIRELAALEDGE